MRNYYFNLLIYSFRQLIHCGYGYNRLCSLFICVILFSNQAKAQQSGYQLAYQETFEAPISSPWTSSSTTWDATESVSPTHSLNYTRTSTTQGPMLGPSVSFTPGQSCYASVMMKTANLSTGTQGASIIIEAYNSGAYISGVYSGAFRGTTWTEVRTPNYTIPPNATTVKVYIYLQGGATGTVWFDDFKYFAVPTKPLASKMVTPSYRGLLMDNEYDQIELSTKLLTSPANYYSRVKLLDANDQIIATQTGAAGQTPFTAIFPAGGLASGTYKVLAEAVDNATNQPTDSNVYTIKKLGAADAKPQNYVDKYGRLIVNGQPYFTLGAYYGTLSDAQINETKNSPLNTVLSYQFKTINTTMLDKFQAAGLKTLYAVQNGTTFYTGTDQQQADSLAKYVNLYKNHPAVLGWYTNDETNIGTYGPQMLAHQKVVEAADYNHPTYGVDLTLPTGEFTTKANDMFGTDFYPVHNDASSVSNPGAWTKFVKNELPHRAPMTVIQSFKWGGAGDRYPTVPEMRSMSWQSIAEGATGLMYYAYFELDVSANYPVLWGNLKQVTQEIKAMAPAILSVEQVPNVTITGAGTWMNSTVRKYNNRVYVIAVNNQKTAYQGVTFNVPNAATVKVLNEDRTLAVTTGSFTDAFDSLAVHIYEISLNTGNVNPTVSIASPANNANIKDPATINITANAADADGTVTKVEFFQGETKLGEDLTAPYSFSWTNMPAGDYDLTAKVWDNSGIFTVSETVNVTVSPVVNGVISPIADAYVRDGSANINTNFGTAATLVVKNDNSGGFMRESYLKFDLNGLNNFEKATLRLNVSGSNVNTLNTQWRVYYVPNDGWTETGITWSNKPAVGTLLATINGLRSGWAEWDISAQVLAELGADKVLSLKIVSTLNSNTADVSFNSKEASNTGLIPQLLLTSAAKAPVVSITSPVAGASFNAPATIAITANATDTDGTITKVEFFEGANKLGEATAAPYTFNWNNVAAGTYNLSAKATDNDGVVSTSAVTNITVNATPTVSITSPVANASFNAPATIAITANAADADGTISKVEFYQGSTKLGEDLTAPYSFNWTNVSAGAYSITAKATDNNGAITTSSQVSVSVNSVLGPIADAYVRDGSANINTNYGTSTALSLKKDGTGYNREIFMKFDLSSISSFSTAKLRLNLSYANTNASATTWSVYYVSSDSWTETGVNWSNKPASSTLIATISGQGSGWAEWNISSQALSELAGDKILSLRIVSNVLNSTSDVTFNSKEASNSNLRPQLLLQPSGTGSKMTLDKNDNALAQNEQASEETVDDSDIKLYPNPVYDKFNVALSRLEANATISIYNVLGAKMSDVRFTSLPQEVSVESLPTGTYYVVIQNGKEIFNRVIIKK